MKIQIPCEELAHVMCDVHPDLAESIEGQQTTGPDLIDDLLAERSGRMLAMHNAMYFCIRDGDVYIVETEWLHFIGEIAGYIQACFDNCIDGWLDLPTDIWVNYGKDSADAWSVFGLSGDNDVDNCGGNITDLLKGIFEYCKRHHIVVKPMFPAIE